MRWIGEPAVSESIRGQPVAVFIMNRRRRHAQDKGHRSIDQERKQTGDTEAHDRPVCQPIEEALGTNQ